MFARWRNWRNARRLVFAAAAGDLPTARALLDAGVPVDVVAAGSSPLLTAAGRGHAAVVELLVQRGARADTPVLPDGSTSLHSVPAFPSSKAALMTMIKGSNINVRAQHGLTPLMSAALFGNLTCLQVLLEAGADVDARATGGQAPGPPFDLAGASALTFAIRTDNAEAVALLRQRGAATGQPLANGFVDLHVAVLLGCNREIVRDLVHLGADLNGRVSDGPFRGATPLTLAFAPPMVKRFASPLEAAQFIAGRQNVIFELVSCGADPDVRDADGRSARDHAAAAGGALSLPE